MYMADAVYPLGIGIERPVENGSDGAILSEKKRAEEQK